MMNHIKDSIWNLIGNINSGSITDNIFVIGKGPSIDEIKGLEMRDNFIINLNDSEKVIKGHLGIFSSDWVLKSLKETGFSCKLYLSGQPISIDVPHAVLPQIPPELADEEFNLFRLTKREMYDEKFLLINALKVSVLLGELTGRIPNVYLLGFDFSTQKGEISKQIGKDFAADNSIDRQLTVNSQENDFLQFLHYFREKKSIHITHVGYRDYSELSPSRFIEKFNLKKSQQPPSTVTGDNENKVLIVAEFTNNHLGDMNRLVEMVERAKEAGADMIKVQKRDVDSFYSDEKLNSYYWSPFGNTLRDYRKGVELGEKELQLLSETCKKFEINWFCSILDYQSFSIINSFSPSLVKIPSTISNHRDFHEKVADAYQGPIVISTGFTDKSYEDYILKTFANNEKIYLLHCISSYPTAIEDCNIAVVQHYSRLAKEYPQIIPGYSSHDLGSFGSLLAVASGAKMLEKHVKLGDVEWVHFDKVALDLKTDSFKNYVREIRNAEIALGSSVKRILNSEHHKYEVVLKNK